MSILVDQAGAPTFTNVIASNVDTGDGVDMLSGVLFDFADIIDLPYAYFGAKFSGLTVLNTYPDIWPHEYFSGTPSNPLTVESPGQYDNICYQTPGSGDKALAGVSGYYLGLPPEEQNSTTYVDSVGEGAICVLFKTDQTWISLVVTGLNGPYDSGNIYTLEFYNRSGTLLDTKSFTWGGFPETSQSHTFKTSSGNAEIAGFALTNVDVGGVGIREVGIGTIATPTTYTAFHLINAFAAPQLIIDAVLENGIDLYYINKDPSVVNPYARYITYYHDLDSVNWKHIKAADLIGDYGDNQVTLKWDKTGIYGDWHTLATQTYDLPENALRWHNLGHARRTAFMIDWSGNSNIAHKAIEVIYNIKTQ